MKSHPILIIAGATASGKSARAMELAKARNGVILNADASQCYADLRILTARPTAQDEAQAEHRLYGIWNGDKAASVGDWLAALKPEVEACWQSGKLPILCGGTGMYLKAAMEGLSPIPDIPPQHREEMRNQPNAVLYEELKRVDPAAASSIPEANTQRLVRALEVYRATGKPMSQWQAIPREEPFPDAAFEIEIIDLPREELYARCDARWEGMLAAGAVAEMHALRAKNYAPHLPIMKAVGVPELSDYLDGKITLEEASSRAKQSTRNYAKRQLTWFRNQL